MGPALLLSLIHILLAALQGFDALSKFGISVSDELDMQGNHSIVLRTAGASDSFSASLCKYITVSEVTSNIQFESTEYGSFVLADGVITQIVTMVDGWTSCTNAVSYTHLIQVVVRQRAF